MQKLYLAFLILLFQNNKISAQNSASAPTANSERQVALNSKPYNYINFPAHEKDKYKPNAHSEELIAYRSASGTRYRDLLDAH